MPYQNRQLRCSGNNGVSFGPNNNLFQHISGDAAVDTTHGIKDISGRGNVFLNVAPFELDDNHDTRANILGPNSTDNPYCQNPTAPVVGATAFDTLILGGFLTEGRKPDEVLSFPFPIFEDCGWRTQIIDTTHTKFGGKHQFNDGTVRIEGNLIVQGMPMGAAD